MAQNATEGKDDGLHALLQAGAAAFSRNDIGGLRATGKQLSLLAYLHADNSMVLASASFYSLAKFLEKQYILADPKWPPFVQKARELLGRAIDEAGNGSRDSASPEASAALEALLSECDEVSELLGRFHVSVTEKARVKIAADFYARGASLGSASQLAGADKSSVLSYIGVTRITDKYETIPVNTRLKAAEELFTHKD